MRRGPSLKRKPEADPLFNSVLVSQLTSWQDHGLFTDVAVHVGTLSAVIIYLRSHIRFETFLVHSVNLTTLHFHNQAHELFHP